MSATLPPGWVGTKSKHQFSVGTITATVTEAREYHGFMARKPTPLGHYQWTVRIGRIVAGGPSGVLRNGTLTAPEARTAALLALQTLLATAVAEVGAALAALTPTEP